MRMRKGVCTQGEFSTLSMEHLHLWYLGKECLRYHSRLAELIAIKKGEQYAKTMSWIRSRISFALLRAVLICLRGYRTIGRIQRDIKNANIDIETVEGAI